MSQSSVVIAGCVHRAIHAIAIALWAGGLYTLGLVVGPVAKKMEKPQIAIAIQKRMRFFVWGAVPIIVITGLLEARARQTILGVNLGDGAVPCRDIVDATVDS